MIVKSITLFRIKTVQLINQHQPRHVEVLVDVRVFKAPFVEPIYPLGYSDLKPEINDERSPVFLATSAQVYPRITAWNSSVGLAKQAVAQLLSGARRT